MTISGGNGLFAGETEWKVTEDLYRRCQPGDQVEVMFHPGALGMPWAEVALVK